MTYLPLDIHVIWRKDINYWCARSIRGDYGINKSKKKVILIAKDAISTSGKYNRLVLHAKDGRIERTITRFKKLPKPSSQFFQDSVP